MTPARAKRATAANVVTPARATGLTTTKAVSPARADLDTIKTLGALLDDLEAVRIMNGNRIGALERDHGEPLPHLVDIGERVAAIEHLAHLELVRAWRRHPLAPWAKGYHGLGEKSIARLIAAIGDPAERPNPGKLFAYCGHGDARRKKSKGMTQAEALRLGKPRAKRQVWLISTSLLKAGNRASYDARRLITAGKLHEGTCVRCGPSGKPAMAGSPWSLAHQHADALRVMGKAFLLDLWLASRQGTNVTQASSAGGES